MRFGLSDEQQALREAARTFLATLPGPGDEPGFDPSVWSRMVDEQGWQAIAVPESAGGWGYGLVELAVVFEATGATLTPSPLFGTCALATQALVVLGDPEGHLEAIAAGATATAATGLATRREGTLTGRLERVVDGHTASRILVPTEDGVFVVPADAVRTEPLPVLDPTRPLATVHLEHVQAVSPLPGRDLAAAWRRARVLLAAEQVGAADAVLALTVEYAGVRKQFGRPIGSFQAVQHACADMLLGVEAARSAAMYAAWAVDADAPDAELASRTAAAVAGDALFACAGQAIQLHGGIGFTWEHPCHRYLKRARASTTLLGSPSVHRAAVAEALLGPAEAPWI